MANRVVDLYIIYQIIKRIGTPFEDTDAFKAGLIDAKGKKLRKATSSEDKKALTYFDRFVFNIKRLLSRVGLDSKMSNYAAALFMLKESQKGTLPTDEEMIEGIKQEIKYLKENSNISYKEMFLEDAPAMSTGAAVAGTGDDPVHWKKRRRGRPRVNGKMIDGVAYIKRMNKKRAEEARKTNEV